METTRDYAADGGGPGDSSDYVGRAKTFPLPKLRHTLADLKAEEGD